MTETDPVMKSLEECFENFFTKAEMIAYMKDKHQLKEETMANVYDAMILKSEKYKDTDYEEQAQIASVKRRNEEAKKKKRARENAKKKVKKQLTNDRLKILPATALELAADLTESGKKILSFFVTRDFSTDASYMANGEHNVCVECHCFTCNYEYSKRLSSSTELEKIEEIMEAYN